MIKQSDETALLVEMLDAVAEAAILIDADGVIQRANSAVAAIFSSVEDYRSLPGEPVAAFFGRLANDGEFAVTSEGDRLSDLINAAHDDATRTSDTRTLRMSDGRWIRCRASVCASGAVVLLINDQTSTVKKDILLEDLAASLGDGVAIWNQSGALAMMSDGYAEHLNAGAASDLINRPNHGTSLDRWAEIGEVTAEADALGEETNGPQGIRSRWGFTVRLSDGRDLLICERRTREGGVASIVADVTNLKDAHRALADKTQTLENSICDLETAQAAIKAEHEVAEEAKARLQSILENMIEGLAILDRDGRITSANPATRQLFGLPDSALVGQSFVDLFDDNGRATVAKALDTANKSQGESGTGMANDIVINHSDGLKRFISLRIGHAAQSDGDLRIVTLRDTTGRKKLEHELRTLATTDPLTGLNNHHRFLELAEHEYERFKRFGSVFSILVMDIDHFKAINDQHGHAAGDAALVKFAEICRTTLREIDFLGRLGGEEFAAVLPGTDTVGALNAAERLRGAVETTRIEYGSIHFRMTFSTGACTLDSDISSLDNAFRRADEALYLAKDNGRNRVELATTSTPGMNPQSVAKTETEPVS